MSFGTLEILALILIAIAAIKLIILIINPDIWYIFIEKLYSKPQFISIIALLLAALVLYLIINSGVTIVEILAVCLFIALLMMVGIAQYAGEIVNWVREKDHIFIMKELWLYTIVWLLLLIWGVQKLFFD